jgi:hypothetical protein
LMYGEKVDRLYYVVTAMTMIVYPIMCLLL